MTATLLVRYGGSGRPTDEANWRAWASAISNLPALKAVQVPGSEFFRTWQDWAFRLNETLLLLGL